MPYIITIIIIIIMHSYFIQLCANFRTVFYKMRFLGFAKTMIEFFDIIVLSNSIELIITVQLVADVRYLIII